MKAGGKGDEAGWAVTVHRRDRCRRESHRACVSAAMVEALDVELTKMRAPHPIEEELQRQIDALEDPNERVSDRAALHALMSQQACAAPTIARWVKARLTKKRRKRTS